MQHLLLQQVIPSAAARLTARDTLSYTGFSQVCCAPNHSQLISAPGRLERALRVPEPWR